MKKGRNINMILKKIQLWEDNKHVELVAYILDNSKEFKTNEKRPAVIICPGGGYVMTSACCAEICSTRISCFCIKIQYLFY